MPFDFFNNAKATVTRPKGERTAAGFERSGTQTVLETRGDFQESGRSLERAQQVYETGDGLFLADCGVSDVEPGDEVTINHDDGRTLEGSVEDVIAIDNSLLISL